MNTDNQIDVVEKKLIDRLRLNLDSLPDYFEEKRVKFPNAPFNTPNGEPWLRCNIINNGPFDQDASGLYEINSGYFIVGVFYPKGAGSQLPLQVGQAIKGLYTGEKFADLSIESARVNPLPENESDIWYMINVQVNFTFEGHTS